MKANNKAKELTPQTAEPPKFLTAYNLLNEGVPSLEGKKGFEIYQGYRDFFINIAVDPEKLRLFESASMNLDLIADFQLFDPAYLDNFLLSLILKLRAPEFYDEEVKKLDKYVRPEKRNEGLNYLHQECGGFLVLLLINEGITARQSLHMASKLTGYSESTIEKSYRSRMLKQRKKIRANLPPPVALTLLYWTLYNKKTNPENIPSVKAKSLRSENEVKKTISAYWRLTEKAVRHYHDKILEYAHKNSLSVIHTGAEEFGVFLPLSEEKMKKTDTLTACFIFCVAFVIEEMPGVIDEFDRQYTQKT